MVTEGTHSDEVRPTSGSANSASFEIEEVMHPPDDDLELLQEFITEAVEHLEAADQHLLTLESTPDSADALNAVFRAFHTIKGVAGFLDLFAIQHLSHQAESLLDLARKGTVRLEGETLDLTFEAADQLKQLVELLRGSLERDEEATVPPSVAPLLQRLHTASSPPAPAAAAETRLNPEPPPTPEARPKLESEPAPEAEPKPEPPPTPEIEPPEVRRSSGGVDERAEAAAPAPARQPAKSKGAGRELREPVKVPAARLDDLIDLIGELVIAESMVTQSPLLRERVDSHLARQMAQLDKITRELQELGTSLRMVPIRGVFQKMQRLGRDLAKRAGKAVEIQVAGLETELDKTVVDNIGDPLVHMIRNAIDHGIEGNVELRRAAGKPDKGRVELRASHRGGSIFIEIEDDGSGLDRARIAAKAREKGLIDSDDGMSDREVFSLIFEPGFSTAQVVSDVSGRGVGMDVVRRNVETLRGQIEISSPPGRGTTISIRLPLTLAIIDGMIVAAGEERYIIPTLSVVRSTRPLSDEVEPLAAGGFVLHQQGRVIPVFSLGRLFEVPHASADPAAGIVVIVEDDGHHVGLLVDELVGQQQIVIKSLGWSGDRVEGVSGGAIMSDGLVGLILDVAGVIRLARRSAAGRSVFALEEVAP